MTDKEFRKVSIVATLGPASQDRDTIMKLTDLGVDVFRNNMSHATIDELKMRLKAVRAAEKRVSRPIAFLGDLMGPKIRIGNVQAGTRVEHGARVKIVARSVWGNADMLSLNFPEIIRGIRPGAEIFLGDGDVKLEVDRVTREGDVLATVIVGGELRSRMGFSCHGLAVSRSTLTAKDKRDVATLLKLKADIIAVSFVQSERDVIAIRKLLPRKDPPLIIAKIETMGGVKNAEKILEVADGLMVARGDLGFSVPMTEIPFIQKDLIRLCLKKSKPVITATQMLESMIRAHIPTRAEVADVTKAVLDGTDAVMLSAETAFGQFPEEAVRTMARIAHRATINVVERDFPDDDATIDAVSASVIKVADQIKSRLIIVLTSSGATARRIARHRPMQPVLALCPSQKTIRDLALTWGVHPITVPVAHTLEHALALIHKAAIHNQIVKLKAGEPYVICAGVPFGKSGGTNLVLIQRA